MSKMRAVGIDLGTTLSAAACLSDSGQSTMLRNADGELLTPSVVYFGSDRVVVGTAARESEAVEPDKAAVCVKRSMGDRTFARSIHGMELPPEVIQACILRQLKSDIAAAVGDDFKVVITVPAFFDEPRRKATSDAGEMAGLTVLDIVNEPTAAALAFGEHLGYLTSAGSPRQEVNVLVYDLGGGTFDVTLIRLKPGDLRTLATDGDVHLGGVDWDRKLVDMAAEAFRDEHADDPRGDPVSLARLQQQAEQAKHQLSVRTTATITVKHAGRTTVALLSREQFEETTEHLLERTAVTTEQVVKAAGLKWDDVDRVLLVGGSTRMPMVSRRLEELSGITPDHSVNPDEAVARGAAIYAGYLLSVAGEAQGAANFQVVDVNSHSLGIEGIDQQTGRKENVILIPHNTSLPVRVRNRFVTKMASQKSVVIKVLEGESLDPDGCITIGKAVLRNLPPGLRQGYPIDVSYRYATNGRLDVRARLPGTDREMVMELQRDGSMSPQQVSRWTTVITSNKGFNAFESALGEERQGGNSASQITGDSVATVLPAGESTASATTDAADTSVRWAGQPGKEPGPNVPQRQPGQPVQRVQSPDSQQPSPTAANQSMAAKRRKSSGSRYTLLSIAGHVVAAVLGLLIGYLLLTYVLNIPLPLPKLW